MKEFRTAYGPKVKVQTINTQPSMTKQSFAQETDVNWIVAQYQRTGVLAHRDVHEGNYGEFDHAVDFHEALNIVREAEELFMTVPSNIRNQFENDPGQFLAFVQDPANIEEMREMGLAKPQRPEPAPPADPVPEAPLAQPDSPPGE